MPFNHTPNPQFRSLEVMVVCELGSFFGHLLRLQPVMKALHQQGHRVTLATPQPSAASALLQNSAVTYVRCPSPHRQAGPGHRDRDIVCYADILDACAFGDDDRLDDALEIGNLINQAVPREFRVKTNAETLVNNDAVLTSALLDRVTHPVQTVLK